MEVDDVCDQLNNLNVYKDFMISNIKIGNINCDFAKNNYQPNRDNCNCLYHENKKGIIECHINKIYTIADDFDHSNREFMIQLYSCIIRFNRFIEKKYYENNTSMIEFYYNILQNIISEHVTNYNDTYFKIDYSYYNSYRFHVLYEYIEELDKHFPSEESIMNCKY